MSAGNPGWECTRVGRVVYDHKRHSFTGRDVARVGRSYCTGLDPASRLLTEAQGPIREVFELWLERVLGTFQISIDDQLFVLRDIVKSELAIAGRYVELRATPELLSSIGEDLVYRVAGFFGVSIKVRR